MGSENINPWLHIWTSPKKTMRAILDTDPTRVIIWLATIGGVLSSLASLGFWWTQYPNHQYAWNALVVIGIVVLGCIIGLINLYVGGWLYKLTGSWLGGSGTFIEVKSAVGWSNYPLILANIAGLISIWSAPNPWLKSIFGLINVIIMVWAFIILLNMVGEAHRISAWRALLAVIIACILIFVVVMLISLIIPLLAPLFV